MPGYTSDLIVHLMEAISSLKTPEECLAFFDDLCTIKEIQDMAQRFETAIQLADGKNYRAISEDVGVSTATISRVSRCLNYGSGGYRKAIDSIKKTENK
ncbi:MAG: hypothetical protein IKH67_06095 [Lachnospiraceae bacterium]|nr:hypothetical protein [Lachnospiraceae bacterium]